jgi:anti-anti-sigma factor
MTSPDGNTHTIAVAGQFNFTLHREFRDAYRNLPSDPVTQYVVDLSRADYLDSSALGMLLLLRDHAGGQTANVRICNFSPTVGKILMIANFHRLFTMMERAA